MRTKRWGRGWMVRGLVATVAVAGLAGCETTTAPERTVDTLLLVAVEDAALPAVAVDQPDLLLEILADTIRFREEGRWERQRVERVTGIDGIPREESATVEGNVEWKDGLILLIPACGVGGDCLPFAQLVPERGGYRMEVEVVQGVVLTHHFRIGHGP